VTKERLAQFIVIRNFSLDFGRKKFDNAPLPEKRPGPKAAGRLAFRGLSLVLRPSKEKLRLAHFSVDTTPGKIDNAHER
jgi:hypothetical protein